MPGRVNEDDYEVRKRAPAKAVSARNHFYVTKLVQDIDNFILYMFFRKTSIPQQIKRVEDLLNNEFDEVYLHGLGASLNKALALALEVFSWKSTVTCNPYFQIEKKNNGSIQHHIQTTTVNVCFEFNKRVTVLGLL